MATVVDRMTKIEKLVQSLGGLVPLALGLVGQDEPYHAVDQRLPHGVCLSVRTLNRVGDDPELYRVPECQLVPTG